MYVPTQSVISFHTESELHVDHAVYTLFVVIGFYALILAVAVGVLFVVRSQLPHLRVSNYVTFAVVVPIFLVTLISTAMQVRTYNTIHQDCQEFIDVSNILQTKIPAILAIIAGCDIPTLQAVIQSGNDNSGNDQPLIKVLNYVQDQYQSMHDSINDAMVDTIDVVYTLQTSFITPFLCLFAFGCILLSVCNPSRKWLPVLLLAWAISAVLLIVVQTSANACMAPSASVLTAFDLTTPLVVYYIRCAMDPTLGTFPLKVELAFLKYVSTLNLTQHACNGPAIVSGLLDFVVAADCGVFATPIRDAVTTLCTDTYMAYMLMYICMTLIFSILVIVMV